MYVCVSCSLKCHLCLLLCSVSTLRFTRVCVCMCVCYCLFYLKFYCTSLHEIILVLLTCVVCIKMYMDVSTIM